MTTQQALTKLRYPKVINQYKICWYDVPPEPDWGQTLQSLDAAWYSNSSKIITTYPVDCKFPIQFNEQDFCYQLAQRHRVWLTKVAFQGHPVAQQLLKLLKEAHESAHAK